MDYSQPSNFDTTIYKKDSAGKIRFLHVYNNGADVMQESGVVGTTSPIIHKATAKAKNVGKINETMPEMQARLEAAAKVANKMSTGYFTTIKEAKEGNVILPMLAKDATKMLDKIQYPCYIQPKLDGMRALYEKGKMISRKGKAIETMDHIIEDVTDSFLNTHHILDGELYAHGRTFQENMRLIKKDRGEETKEVKFHVYDLILDKPFAERYALLQSITQNYAQVEIVPTLQINNEEELKKHHALYIAEGYEGTIIRHTDDGYVVNKRASQLLKYKDFIDETYEVVDIVPSDKNPNQGVVHCTIGGGYDNVTFGCGMKFSHDEREEMLNNKEDYIGKIAEIRFFEYTDGGLPRFPVCHGFRLDK